MNIEEINARFTSGNSIPVERAYLKGDEWKAIYDMLKRFAYPDMSKINTPLGPLHHAGIALEAEHVAAVVRRTVGFT